MNTTNRKPPVRTRRSTAAATVAPAAPEGPLFDPVEREPAYTRVSSAIEAKIMSRAMSAGDVLPAETDLAQQFRVHRSTVREALRQLESAGLVVRPPGAKRMVVSRPHAAKVSSGMRHALVLHNVTFVDVWEAMMVIEPEVAALAATRRTQSELDALVQAAEAFRTWPKDDPNAVDVVAEFFQVMGAALAQSGAGAGEAVVDRRAGAFTGAHDRHGAAGATAHRGCAAADHHRRARQERGRSAQVDVEARPRLSARVRARGNFAGYADFGVNCQAKA